MTTKDHLGNVINVIDVPAGTMHDTNEYTPYGELARDGLTTDIPYAGLYSDGIYYYSATRVYDPEIGRWMSRDPIGEVGGINIYLYVQGDPINWIDPSGLYCGEGLVNWLREHGQVGWSIKLGAGVGGQFDGQITKSGLRYYIGVGVGAGESFSFGPQVKFGGSDGLTFKGGWNLGFGAGESTSLTISPGQTPGASWSGGVGWVFGGAFVVTGGYSGTGLPF